MGGPVCTGQYRHPYAGMPARTNFLRKAEKGQKFIKKTILGFFFYPNLMVILVYLNKNKMYMRHKWIGIFGYNNERVNESEWELVKKRRGI